MVTWALAAKPLRPWAEEADKEETILCVAGTEITARHGLSCIWAKWGRFVMFPVLCLLAFEDAALKSQFLLSLEAHKKGCGNDTFCPVIPSVWVSWSPKIL